MEAVTGKAIVTSMMRLATEMSNWNKAYATEDIRQSGVGYGVGFIRAAACQQGQSVFNAFQAGGRRLCAEKSGKGWR